MNSSVHARIKHLIEETNDAYSSFGGTVNADYAEFASLALSEFKNALHKPDLTDHELRHIIRKGMNQHRKKNPSSCWATFMALYVANGSNANIHNGAHWKLRDIYKENP